MESIKIRKISIEDIDQLREIGTQTFIETYSSGNSEENLKEYIENAFSHEQLETELVDENSEFYFLKDF